jgi:hypothetical protein
MRSRRSKKNRVMLAGYSRVLSYLETSAVFVTLDTILIQLYLIAEASFVT